MTVVITGSDLTLEQLVRVANAGDMVRLADDVASRMTITRSVVETALRDGDAVYGLTTGVGVRKRIRLDPADVIAYNRTMVLNHRVGFGPPAPEALVRATILRLINGMARGTTGVRPAVAQLLVTILNENQLPVVRSSGSLGQGDVAPMADVAYKVMNYVSLEASEGLALVNNNAYSTACAALALERATQLIDTFEMVVALDLEALAARVQMLDPAIAEQRSSPGVARSLNLIRDCLRGSYLFEEGAARNLQDPLTFRGSPMVHGNFRDTLAYTIGQLQVELNAPQENPMVLADGRRIMSVSNFDIVALAAGLDYVRIALAVVLTSACERTLKLLQSPMTGLPEGLAPRSGLSQDGLSEFGKAAQAVTLEARLLAGPVSFAVASSTEAEGIEDRVTMAPLAARRLAEMVALGERLAAIALMVSCQAVDLRSPLSQGLGTSAAYGLVRDSVQFVGLGDVVPQDLETLVDDVSNGLFSATATGSERVAAADRVRSEAPDTVGTR